MCRENRAFDNERNEGVFVGIEKKIGSSAAGVYMKYKPLNVWVPTSYPARTLTAYEQKKKTT